MAATGLLALATGCAGSAPRPSPQAAKSFPASSGARPGGTGNARYGLVSPAQETPGTGSRSGVTGGALFGGTTALGLEQGKLGRKLAIARVYYQLGEQFPRKADQQLMSQGTTLLVSLDTIPGGPTYSSIAAGHEDATISAFLDAVNQAGVRYNLAAIYFCFEHEMDVPRTHRGLGTPGQFIQAWDHIRQLAQSAHLDWNDGGRIHWVFIMTHYSYKPPAARADWAQGKPAPTAFWPGAAEVDIVAADGYNSDGCKMQGSSITPQALFSPVISFAHAYGGLPVFIAEWGSTPRNPGGGQAKFIRQMASFVSANREVAAVMYWDNMGARCTFSINNYPLAISAMASLGRSPVLQGHLF
jgi:hypothetical protein